MATGVELNENTNITINTPGNSLGCASYMMLPSKFLQNRGKSLMNLTLQSFNREQLTNLVLSPHFPSRCKCILCT